MPNKREDLTAGIRESLYMTGLQGEQAEEARRLIKNPTKSKPENKRLSESGTPEVPELRSPVLPNSGTSELRDFTHKQKSKSRSSEVPESSTSGVPESGSTGFRAIPKFATLDRIDVRLTNAQIQRLTDIVSQIKKNRTKKTERITASSVIRSLIKVLPQMRLDLNEIPDETELARRILHRVGPSKKETP